MPLGLGFPVSYKYKFITPVVTGKGITGSIIYQCPSVLLLYHHFLFHNDTLMSLKYQSMNNAFQRYIVLSIFSLKKEQNLL